METSKGQNARSQNEVFESPVAAPARRPRSMTVLKLEVIAERVRKFEKIRRAIENGTYTVNSRTVAAAMIGASPEGDIQ